MEDNLKKEERLFYFTYLFLKKVFKNTIFMIFGFSGVEWGKEEV